MKELIEHLKKQLEFYRDKWMNESEPEFQRGKYHGRFFAYKEVLDGFGYVLEPQSDAVELLAWYCQNGYDYMFYDGELTFHKDRDPISKPGITITELYNKFKEEHK